MKRLKTFSLQRVLKPATGGAYCVTDACNALKSFNEMSQWVFHSTLICYLEPFLD